MTRAVIVAAVRTPVGRYGGGLAGVRPDDLAALARRGRGRACRRRAGRDRGRLARLREPGGRGQPQRRPHGGAARRPARSVAGVTVNRLCASGLSAVVGACHAVVAGDGDLFVAGGVESMTPGAVRDRKPETAVRARRPQTLYDTTLGWRFVNPRFEERYSRESMGETGENVAERWGVSRDDQDAFALRVAARAGRRPPRRGASTTRSCPRRASSATSIRGPTRRPRSSAPCKPAFREGGTVTAGNASGINDGAAALVIASEERAEALGIETLGASSAAAVAGVDPAVMGIGPVPAVAQAARAHRDERRRARPRRAQRGVRLPEPRRRSVSSGSTRRGSTSTAARSRSATRSG